MAAPASSSASIAGLMQRVCSRRPGPQGRLRLARASQRTAPHPPAGSQSNDGTAAGRRPAQQQQHSNGSRARRDAGAAERAVGRSLAGARSRRWRRRARCRVAGQERHRARGHRRRRPRRSRPGGRQHDPGATRRAAAQPYAAPSIAASADLAAAACRREPATGSIATQRRGGAAIAPPQAYSRHARPQPECGASQDCRSEGCAAVGTGLRLTVAIPSGALPSPVLGQVDL